MPKINPQGVPSQKEAGLGPKVTPSKVEEAPKGKETQPVETPPVEEKKQEESQPEDGKVQEAEKKPSEREPATSGQRPAGTSKGKR